MQALDRLEDATGELSGRFSVAGREAQRCSEGQYDSIIVLPTRLLTRSTKPTRPAAAPGGPKIQDAYVLSG